MKGECYSADSCTMLQSSCSSAAVLDGSLGGASQESAQTTTCPMDCSNDDRLDGGTTVDALSDELLLEVLAHVGVPRTPAYRSMVVSSSALKVRHTHLSCRREHVCYKLPQDVEKAAELWRRSFAYTGLPEELLALPLWSCAPDAELMYDGLAVQRSYTAVCKRWRGVLGLDQVKTAVCGVEDRPPANVETLIVAWDWNSHHYASDDLLEYLADLPKLRTLVLWDSSQFGLHGTPRGLRSASPPPLPRHLRALQHLIVLTAPVRNLDTAEAFLRSVADQHDLRTLVHPQLRHVAHWSFCDLVRKFPRLANLDSDGEWGLGLSDVVHLTDLRRLRIFASIEGDPVLIDQVAGPEHLVSNPLASLRALESLDFTADPRYGRRRGLDTWRFPPSVLGDLSSLKSLTHLCFEDLTFAQTSLQLVAAAPVLQSLRFVHCAMEGLAPLVALAQRLTSLHVLRATKIGSSALPVDVSTVTSLTALADLRLADCAHSGADERAPFLLSDAHARLTRLELTRCRLSAADGAAIARMAALKHLRWIDVQGVTAADDVLAALQPLVALESLAVRSSDSGVQAALARLLFSILYPRLRELELGCFEGLDITEALLPELSLASNLEVVRLINGMVADGAMPDLSRLRELRTLELAGIKGNLVWCLASLCSCPKLRVVSVSSKAATIRPAAALPELPFTLLWR